MSCSRSDKLAGNADEVRFQLNERGDVEKHPKDASDEELKNSKSKKAVHTTSLCQPNVDSERNSTIGVEFCTSTSNLTTDSENRITSQKTCDTERLSNDDKGKNVTSSLQSMCQASSNLLQEEEIDYTSKLQNKRENKPLPTGIFTTIATSRDIDAFALKRNVCAEKIEDKKSNAFEESLSRDQLVTGVMPVSEIANFKEQEAIQENGFSIDYFLERTQESNLRQNEVPKTYFLQEFQSTNFNGENTYSFDERRSNTSVVNMCDQTSMVVNESEAYSEKNSSDKSREKVAKNNEIPGLPQSITWNLPSDGFLNSHAIISPHFLRAPLFFSPSHLYPFVPLPAPLLSPQIVPLPPAVTFAGSQASYISELSQIDYFRRRPPPCFWIINRSTCSKPEIEEVCNRQFETISEIVYHISDMHLNSLNNSTGNSNEQYYYCFWKDCLRSMKPFRARYKLVNHIRVHTGERPFLCHFPSCGKRFARSENLKIHKRVHSGERPFICEYSSCSRRFTNSSDRKKHMHTHTTEKELDSITRPEKLSKQLTKHSRKRLNSDEDITPHIYVKNETLKQEKPENLLRENYQMMNSPSCVNTMLSIKSHAIIQDLENSVNHHLHQVGEKALIN